MASEASKTGRLGVTPLGHAFVQQEQRLADATSNEILHFEQLGAEAWPAAAAHAVGGWQVRYTHGVTRRANSVWPREFAGVGREQLEAQLKEVENFYWQREIPSCFLIGPLAQPTELDEVLDARGYVMCTPTTTQRAPLVDLLASIQSRSTSRSTPIATGAAWSEPWLDAYIDAVHTSRDEAPVRQALLERVPGPKLFVHAVIDGRAAATGLGVAQGQWLGLYNITTRPQYRRRGAASAVLGALASWGIEQGCRDAYLQVVDTNTSAVQLYQRHGFRNVYHYHYRELTVR